MGLLSFWSGLVGAVRELVSRGMLEVLARQGRLSAELVATLPRVLLVGEGGAGKSTLLKQLLARAAAAGNVPVWVSLAQLPVDAPLTIAVLLDHLVREAHARLGVGEVNRAFFESLVADGRLAIGFDALDECGSLPQRQRVRGLIEEVAREWKRCQVIVTSRPEALHDTPLPLVTPAAPKDEQFRGLTPRPFTRDDIAPFLRVAFDDGDKLAATLLNRTGIEALTATPLTLTLVGLVARTPKGLPATRTPLFARCLDTVCETWEAAKGAQPPPDGLDATQRLDVLRRLGWAAQAAGGDELDADAARAAIARSP
ncbi:MAG TPA: NACHT domain-containing protein, partial [Burkholderiaceae bacterium]|nr:NACHT domain-containing protein [Burkholderiaceae bacterium]